MFFFCILRSFLDNRPNIRNKSLLNLCMKVHFRFFNKDDLAKRAFFFGSHPLQVKMTDLYCHVDEILEAKAVICFRKFVV